MIQKTPISDIIEIEDLSSPKLDALLEILAKMELAKTAVENEIRSGKIS